ncbi:DUF6508 domain-containing protein [Thermophilibacter mediterraneus]|uniref:DUF6508 domain-containing protein n=1 Tax=Thermophilibacter mediterraneus TaxID=1871031 RepID=UPI0023526689|nr:DUF6508 domain-containing protein [Thermophilibacter mediterraneus]
MYENITRYIDAFDGWDDVREPGRVIAGFLRDLNEIADHSYADTLACYGLDWSAGSMSGADLTDAPAELAIALLTAAYRADHFSNGILENEFIPSGLVSRRLRRLRELDSQSQGLDD